MPSKLFPPIFPRSVRRKGDRRKAAVLLTVIFSLLLIFSEDFRFWVRSFLTYPLHYREYKHFGIRIPGGYSVHGIDVSKWQDQVDWARISKMRVGSIKITFAFIKATEGTWMEDPEFDDNWKNARRNGIVRGAYHYFLPNLSAKDQALQFSRTVKLKSGDLPPVADVEEADGMTKAQVRQYTREFLDLLEKAYKTKPILYTNKDFYRQYFQDQDDFKDCRLWIAHYHVADLEMPDDASWHFWQHSDRGNVNGINEKVDFNVFNGGSAAFKKLCLP